MSAPIGVDEAAAWRALVDSRRSAATAATDFGRGGPYSDELYDRYVEAVRNYEKGWWAADDTIVAQLAVDDAVRRDVVLLARSLVETAVIWRRGFAWAPPRDRLHRAIVDELTPAELNTNVRHAFLLLGTPGSGKSSVLRHAVAFIAGNQPVGVVDSDDVRVRIPEYSTGVGSRVVQSETTHVAYGALANRLVAMRCHVVVDTVGDPRYVSDYAKRLLATGRALHVLCTSIPTHLAVDRAKRRALLTGRYVDPTYIESIGDRPIAALRCLIDNPDVPVESWAVIDTSNENGPTVVEATELHGTAGDLVTWWTLSTTPSNGSIEKET